MVMGTSDMQASTAQAAPVRRNRVSGVLAVAFVLSMLVPIYLPVGSLLLMPYRILLLFAVIPLSVMLFSGKAGRILLIDYLMAFSAFWVALSLFVNEGFGRAIEPAGIHIVEFFGAYVLGRVSIRSADDFRMFTRAFFIVVLCLLPFAALESYTRQPVLLKIIPQSVAPVDAGLRWGLRRAQTIFPHPILYGVFVSTGLGLFWYVMRPRAARLLSAPMVVLATIFSLSSGALIGLVFQTIFILWEMITRAIDRRWTIFAWLSVAAYIVVDILSNRTPFHVIVTYASFNTGSAYNRILIWNFGTDNVAENPFFGVGLADWARPSWMSPSMDNFWLFIAVKYGLPAIIALLLALFLAIRLVSRYPLTDKFDRACRAGYLTALGGLAIAGATVHFWHSIMSFTMFFLASGLWIITGGERREDKQEAAPEVKEKGLVYTRSANRHERAGAAKNWD